MGRVVLGCIGAQAWAPSWPSVSKRSESRVSIRDLATVSSEIQVAEQGKISELRVRVDIAHTYISDLRVELVAPDGVAVLLHDKTGGGNHNLHTSYDQANLPALRALGGKSLRGTWKLLVRDTARFDTGEVKSWELAARVEG